MKKFLACGSFLFLLFNLSLAYAAVENVKVSGDATVRGLWRESYTLGGIEGQDTFSGSIFSNVADEQRFFMSQVRLRVNADVSENIAAEIELLNQRDIDPPSGGQQGGALRAGTVVVGAGPNAGAGDQFEILLNLANITLKGLYWDQLTLRVGRQNLQWGEGFILGASQLGNPDPGSVISADEFSLFNSFDAIRVMYNESDWWADGVAIKVQENEIDSGDDATAFGINIGGKLPGTYQSEGEIYFLGANDASDTAGASNAVGDTFVTTEKLYNLGIRGSIRPIERVKISGENVIQFGKEGGSQIGGRCDFNVNGCRQQDILSWAFDYRGEVTVTELPWPTTFGSEWVFYTGEDANEDGKSGAYRPMFRGKYHSAIREFQGQFYLTEPSSSPAFTNQQQLIFDAVFHPFNRQEITLLTRWLIFWLDEVVVAGRDKYLGNELDLVFGYAHTEDLSFQVIGGLFFPGDYFTQSTLLSTVGSGSETAKELTASMTLNF